MATQDNRLTVVLGMHRSGTSALTEALAQIGMRLSPLEYLLGANVHNEHGHFEDSRIVAMNDRILAKWGASWLNPWPMRKAQPTEDLVQEVRECWDLVDRDAPTLIKDPRFCLTLPWWIPAWEEHSPIFVHMHRHPVNVAASLRQRDGMPEVLAELLWLEYVASAMAHASGRNTISVSFESILTDPSGTVCDVSTLLNVGVLSLGLDSLQASSIDPRLCHHATPTSPQLTAALSLYDLVGNDPRAPELMDRFLTDDMLSATGTCIGQLFQEVRYAEAEANHARNELNHAHAALQSVVGSRMWRITLPWRLFRSRSRVLRVQHRTL